jgi:EAL domain-containing protein (putative c-di-GMP-specific phosphodiesterase class I)
MAAHELLRGMQAASPERVTWSAGLALWDCEESPGELRRRADEALFLAKRHGRGLITLATAGPVSAPDHTSIERGELVVLYQPIVAFDEGDALHVEALLRWDHPQRGRVGPAEFIPAIEENGMIGPIGTWVLEDACRQIALWAATHPQGPSLRVSVNLSPRQLAQPDLTDRIARAVSAAGVSPGSLCLEVTEGAVMDKPEEALETLNKLRRLGVQVAIDDFGTGYSSLAYLKRLPVDELKIDRSFIRDLADDADDRAIVRSTISLGHDLGLSIVAEGIEDTATLELLKELGCDVGQGYHISRPVTADAVELQFRDVLSAAA